MVPRGAEEGPKSDPKRQVEPRTAPRRSHDQLECPGGGGYPQFGVTPGTPFWHPKTTQDEAQNDPKSKRKSQKQKERFKTIKDPS